MGIIHNSFALNFPSPISPKFSQITTKMKFLLTTTFFAVALLQCAYAASDDVKEAGTEAGVGGLDDDEDEEQLTLESGGELDEQPKKFTFNKKAALMCNLVKNIFEGDKTAGSEKDPIEIKQVNAQILKLVVAYLKRHDGKVPAEVPKPIKATKMEKVVEDPKDAEFIDGLTKEDVFQVILAANYMDIKSLLHLGCAKIATLIKGKSPEEIKDILGDDKADGTRRLLEAMMNSKSF